MAACTNLRIDTWPVDRYNKAAWTLNTIGREFNFAAISIQIYLIKIILLEVTQLKVGMLNLRHEPTEM